MDLTSERVRRDIALLLIGALFGGGVAAGIAIAIDDDPTPGAAAEQQASQNDETTGDTTPTIDPTDTDFGELTEASAEEGVKIQWTAEILEGPDTGLVEFVTAHRAGTTVIETDDLKLIDDGETVRVCRGGDCSAASAEASRNELPEVMQPFWEIIRLVEETTSNPQYRITGETQLESGIFERCGTFDPDAFGVVVPDNVNLVSQCVDAQRGVPIRLGLAGDQRSVGGASLTALADADPELFRP